MGCSVAQSTPSVVALPSTTARVTPAADNDTGSACRGRRLMIPSVAELCSVKREVVEGVPASVTLELEAPAKVRRGEEVELELRYVNRTPEAVTLNLRLMCASHLAALDPAGEDVVRHESTGAPRRGSTCKAGPVVEVVLEGNGGMLVEPLRWRALGELHRDYEFVKPYDLSPGTYRLTARSWILPASGAKESDSESAALRALRNIAVE